MHQFLALPDYGTITFFYVAKIQEKTDIAKQIFGEI